MTRRLAFVLAIMALVSGAGLLLRAEPPQEVGTWASIGAAPENRIGAAAVALPDGRTLIAGGLADGTPTAAVVVFDPADSSFATAGQLLEPRAGHTATLLEDGRVLIAGGTVNELLTGDLEIFDPSSGTSTLVATMAELRTGHAAARIGDGKVLIAGGTGTEGVLQTAEIFDPSTGAASLAGSPMTIGRTGASATALIDGRVLIAGGNDGSQDLASAEIYNPSTDSFQATDTNLDAPRSNHTAVLLPHNNSVLIAGGTSDGVPLATANLFLPAQFPDPFSYGMGQFALTGEMAAPRSGAAGGPHIEGYAFVVGGGPSDAEVYRFATIKTDKDDYAPEETAVITGSGWEANEEVTLLFQEDPAVHADYVLTVTADAEGNIYHDQWAPEGHDLGVRFYLMAMGQQSGRRAQTTFTDNINVQNGTVTIRNASCTANQATFTQGDTVCARVVITGISGSGAGDSFFIQWLNPSSVLVMPPSTTETAPSTVPTTFDRTFATTTSTPAGVWTVRLCRTASCNGGNLLASASFTLNAAAAFNVTFDATPIADVAAGTTVLSVTIGANPATAVTKAELPKTFTGIASGTNVSYLYVSPLAVSATKQYRWLSTSGTGSASGQTTQSGGPFSVTENSTVSATYLAQLKVTFDASAIVKDDSSATIVTIDGSPKTAGDLPFTTNFVDDGTSIDYNYSSPVASTALPTTKQYRWDSTSGLSQTLQTNTFNVTAAGTVTGTYVTQFQVTFDASANVKGDSSATIVTVEGSPKMAGDLPFSTDFVDEGSSISYRYSSPVASTAMPTSKQYRWDSTSGLAQTLQTNTFTVTAVGTVTGTYVAQFRVTFDASADVKGDSSATIVTVGGSPKTAVGLPFTTDFIDDGTSLTYSYSSPVASTALPTTKQYRWDSTSGLGQTLQTNTFSVTAAGTVTGTYIAQFLVTFDASANVKADSSATIVTVDAALKTAAALPFAKFIDAGTSVAYNYSSPVASTASPADTRYRWNTTTGLSQTLQANTFVVNAPGTVTGNYVTQFNIAWTQTGLAGTGGNTVVTVNAVAKTAAALPFSDWFDMSASVQYAYATPISTDPVSSIQFELANAGSLPATPITVSAPMVINGDYSTNTYTIQYLQPLDQSSGTNYQVNSGKNGRVIPVKVLIFKNGAAISDSSTVIMKVAGSNCSSGPGADPIEEYADAGQSSANTNLFRWSSPHWIYNLDTKALGMVTNNCYRLDVYLTATAGPTAIKASSLTWAIFKPVK